MLESIAGALVESVTIQIPVELLNEKLLNEIDRLCKERKGKHALKMRLLDKTNLQSLAFSSTGRKVNADSEFLGEMEKLGLECKVN